MIILEENFKWHLEAFASELFIYIQTNSILDGLSVVDYVTVQCTIS